MTLFQTSVLNKYLKGLDQEQVNQAWDKFTAHFHNPTIQENIRNSKEEQYQEGFLRDLFVKVLGYTLNPATDFNLTTELKNIRGAKKTDGAIIQDDKALAVIELKGTNTTDLGKVEAQAFGYKNNQTGCVYVITANFEKLRFYIDNAVEFEEFNLFRLTREQFEVLWLCLAAKHLLKGLPKQIKDESLTQEENVTKKLYKDYAQFRNEIFDDIQENNPEHDKLTLFKKTQKLLDRFLFILFAEDRLLLPPNSIREIVKQWVTLKDELDAYVPLYDRFRLYFKYMNEGHKGKKHDIFAYNGGLFASDEILDNIRISDEVLHKHTQILSNYDFESEVSVNILGHIFEHSLNEIEEIQAELEGADIEKSKSKRKKDGVFYTPKYITKYIVDNTVGRLCEEKKAEFDIQEEEYEKDRRGRKKATIKDLQQKLEDYRSWLLGVTICDPACGSGAFLNQALEFLIKEHRYIDELQAKLFGDSMVLSDVENAILENNLFGVDINEESVDIARLSLWLRTAQKGRKLSSLNNHIKCGNSLIDDPEVAGDKAFNWEKEFSEVFKNGGFDVVIGNPPYVRQELLTPFKPYLKGRYKTFHGTADLFTYFIELSTDRLLRKDGLYSIIVANKWMRANYGKPLRAWMKNRRIIEIIDFGDLPVFSDATAYPCILTLSSKSSLSTFWVTEPDNLAFSDLGVYVDSNKFSVAAESLNESGWALVNERKSNLLEKLKSKGTPLNTFVNGKIFRGVLTGLNDAFIIDEATKDRLIKEDPNSSEIIKPFLAGRDVKRYTLHFQERYLVFSRRGIDIEAYPAIKNYLNDFKERLEPRPQEWEGAWNGRKPGSYKWYEIQDSIDYYEEFEKPKIVFASISKNAPFQIDTERYYSNDKTSIIGVNDYRLLAILNSKVIDFFVHSIASTKANGYYEYKPMYVSQIPVPAGINELNVEKEVIRLIDLKEKKNRIKQKFLASLKRRVELNEITQKLQYWDNLTFSDFIMELKNKKVKLSISQEADWEDYFEAEKKKAQGIKAEIDKTDREIDQMVYELYGLTEEEIRIVEDSVG